MIRAFCIFLIFTTMGCQTTHNTESQPNQQKITILKNEFVDFWNKAKGKPLDAQIKLWNKIVEKDHKDFYNSLAWSKDDRKDWKKRKREKLKKSFKYYEKNYAKILENFNSFETVLKSQIAKYKVHFPDAKFDLPIYAAPSAMSFNGKAGDIDSNPGNTVLAFGMDMIAERNDDNDVLYSHELFHVYHVNLLDINEEKAKKTKLTLPLWLEGFATYVSGVLNPNASDGVLLLDKDLANYKKEMKWLAANFLKVKDEMAWEAKVPTTYYKWFAMGEYRPRKDLPNRTGYLLGLEVSRQLAKKYTLNEMIHWDVDTIHEKVSDGLKGLTK